MTNLVLLSSMLVTNRANQVWAVHEIGYQTGFTWIAHPNSNLIDRPVTYSLFTASNHIGNVSYQTNLTTNWVFTPVKK